MIIFLLLFLGFLFYIHEDIFRAYLELNYPHLYYQWYILPLANKNCRIVYQNGKKRIHVDDDF